ncbi:MAG: sulfate adenylyltransferase [Candidatus Marinimicrobia bacterium]|nr:sulfate adenylyltransferase [Candidatus Neomarinimicrobiota bacterium]|tara:strand:- start:2022 stop:3158 length:1137 start_codon:yes stop_codon:yes gene_type:complete
MNKPHGGTLIDLKVATADSVDENIPAIVLSQRSEADLEMLATGAMSPLRGFMGLSDYRSVLDDMKLDNGLIWPLPVVLPLNDDEAKTVGSAEAALLEDSGGRTLGKITISDIYKADKEDEAESIFLTTDSAHPGVAALLNCGDWYVEGEVEVYKLPHHLQFGEYRQSPADLRKKFDEKEWKTVVGFQTRNPIHRAHEYLTKCALEFVDGLLIHPVVGETKRDDIPTDIRMECYEAIIDHYYPHRHTVLSVYPAFMRYAGPREAIFHAITRKNYGCTHFIVGRDHAGVGDYYGTYDAQRIFDHFQSEDLGIQLLFFEHSFYCQRTRSMATTKTSRAMDHEKIFLSGSKVRKMLIKGESLTEEFTRPEVEAVLRRHYQNG